MKNVDGVGQGDPTTSDTARTPANGTPPASATAGTAIAEFVESLDRCRCSSRVIYCAPDGATAAMLRGLRLEAGTSDPDRLEAYRGAVAIVVPRDDTYAGFMAAAVDARRLQDVAVKVSRGSSAEDFTKAAMMGADPMDWDCVARAGDLPTWTPEDAEAEAAAAEVRSAEDDALDQALAAERARLPLAPESEQSDRSDAADGNRPRKQADILIKLAETVELFHSPDGTAFADIEVNGHRETWPIRSRGFHRWLVKSYYEKTQGAANNEALKAALGVIEAKAHFSGPERVVHVRVAGLEGKIYLDVVDEAWRAIAVDAEGWRIVERPPVRFRRSAGMLPLPEPMQGGTIDALRPFLNVRSDSEFVLVVLWALAALRDRGPYPILALSGEQGSAKSTFSARMRALIDPNTAPLRALPREDRDLFIAANNSHLLAFDNVSGLPPWISDTLCRLATGGAFAVRQLHTDQDEVLFEAIKPVILNGIEDIVTRPDLADRAIILTLEPIPEELRRPEAELNTAFEREYPRILGALLDGMAHGLRQLPAIRLDRFPRLADFAVWASACESAYWPAGTFWAAYTANADGAIEGVLEAEPVADAVRALVRSHGTWQGTASDLFRELGDHVGEAQRRAKSWPTSAKVVSGRLRRAATFLRRLGISIEFTRQGCSRTRMIRISAAPENTCGGSSVPSGSSRPTWRPSDALENRSGNLPGIGLDAGSDTARPCPPRPTDVDGTDGTDDTDALKSDLAVSGRGVSAACRTCGGLDFWTSTMGVRLCRVCRPPAPRAERRG